MVSARCTSAAHGERPGSSIRASRGWRWYPHFIAVACLPQVSVFGRRTGEPKFATVASLDTGFNLQAADWAKVGIIQTCTGCIDAVTKAGLAGSTCQ